MRVGGVCLGKIKGRGEKTWKGTVLFFIVHFLRG